MATVIGTDGHPEGLTANSFVSVSLEPPLVLISVDRASSVHAHFQAAKAFGISILDETQHPVSDRFAYEPGDRFDGIPWHPGPLGSPLLDASLVQLDCNVVQQVVAGDHTLFIGEVRFVGLGEGNPLLYFAGAYQRLGQG